MAVYRPAPDPKPLAIKEFLGINEAVGETEIKRGEATFMRDFRITKNKKAEKRPGKQIYIDASPNKIDGMWSGVISGADVVLFAIGGNLYRRNISVSTVEYLLSNLLVSSWNDNSIWNDANTWDEGANPPVTLVGSLSSATATKFKWFAGKLIIKNSVGFWTYNGTTLAPAVYTVPTVAIGLSPNGSGGTLFQETNVLTGTKKANYIGNGSSVLYQLPETNIDASPSATATVNGTPTSVTVNTAAGTVTFSVAPASNAEVIITWTKASTANTSLILSHKFLTDYGVINDTNMFLFGSDTEKNVFRYSYVGDPFYYPASAFVKVSDDQFAITDIVAQYNTLVVFKERSAHIATPSENPNYTNNKGLNPYEFPYKDLNEAVGNICPGGVQLVENTPVSLYGSSMWVWSSATGIEDERNAKINSDRIKLSLEQQDLRTAATYDSQDSKEYWVSVGGSAYIWNYGNDTMYIYTNMRADQFEPLNGDVLIRDDKKIYLFSENFLDDRDAETDLVISAIMDLGFTDFGSPYYKKVLRDAWVTIAPDTRSSVKITFATNKKLLGELKSYETETAMLDFDDIDFDDFSFDGNTNPRPGYINAKIKDFVFLQTRFENSKLGETLTILDFNLGVQVTGLSKR